MPSISDTLLLPGQPIPLPTRGPAPQLGPGIYERNGQLRASLLGIPHFEGSVSVAFFVLLAKLHLLLRRHWRYHESNITPPPLVQLSSALLRDSHRCRH